MKCYRAIGEDSTFDETLLKFRRCSSGAFFPFGEKPSGKERKNKYSTFAFITYTANMPL
jgi:hypothetical protein